MKIIPLVKLMRLYYSLPFSLGFIVILTYLTCGYIDMIPGKAILSFGSYFCIISAGYILNDYFDIETDRINSPERPLPSGQVKPVHAARLAYILFAAGIGQAFCCTLRFGLVITATALLLIFYDMYSKKMGIFKVIIIGILLASLYPASLTVSHPFSLPIYKPRLAMLLIHPFWLLFTAIGYEMLKDLRDMPGDKIAYPNGSTIKNTRRYLKLARGLLITGAAFALIPGVLHMGQIVYTVSAFAAFVCVGQSNKQQPRQAITLIYISVVLITSGSLIDFLIFGP